MGAANRILENRDVLVVQIALDRKRKHDIEVGDTIISSGLDGVFPKGLRVGRVLEVVKRDAVNHDFVSKHCVFATGPYDIGYGMRNTDKFAFDAEKDIQAKELEVTLDKYEAIAQRRKEGEKVKSGQLLAEWDPYTATILTEVSGRVKFGDIIEGFTMMEQVDEVTGLSRKYAVPFLEWADRTGLTVRSGDRRRLRR